MNPPQPQGWLSTGSLGVCDRGEGERDREISTYGLKEGERVINIQKKRKKKKRERKKTSVNNNGASAIRI